MQENYNQLGFNLLPGIDEFNRIKKGIEKLPWVGTVEYNIMVQ